MIVPTRRRLVATGLIAVAAPAIVRASALMPIKPWTSEEQVAALVVEFRRALAQTLRQRLERVTLSTWGGEGFLSCAPHATRCCGD
jgi:hypothetical protein